MANGVFFFGDLSSSASSGHQLPGITTYKLADGYDITRPVTCEPGRSASPPRFWRRKQHGTCRIRDTP